MDSTHVMILLLAAMVASEQTQKCGEPYLCDCTIPILHGIECQGQDVTVFPSFREVEKFGVTNISLVNTSIVDIFPFDDDWILLRNLYLKNNVMLSCEVIEKLSRPGLQIHSDCVDMTTGMEYTNTTQQPDVTTTTQAPDTVDVTLIVILIVMITGMAVWIMINIFVAYKKYVNMMKENIELYGKEIEV